MKILIVENIDKLRNIVKETFAMPDEMTDEQTVWHNADGSQQIFDR